MEDWIKHIPVIDTHLHLWDINRLNYPWLNEVPAIQKTFLIEDYQQASKVITVERMVFVQCECRPQQCIEEVQFVMEQATKDNRIQGIVAYTPMEQGKAVTTTLDAYKDNALVKGVRRIYDNDPDICCTPSFLDAVNILPSYNLSFDISIKPHSMPATIQMIKACPDTLIILDHLGKPDIKNKALSEFQKSMDTLAALPNVIAKLSGLITEADWEHWTVADLKPYVNHVVQTFGFDRLIFGGDWPVVLLAGTYENWIGALSEVLQPYDRADLLKLFHDNAERAYKL